MIRFLIINDFNTGTTDIIMLTNKQYNNINNLSDYIFDLNYDINNVEYMISSEINFKQV